MLERDLGVCPVPVHGVTGSAAAPRAGPLRCGGMHFEVMHGSASGPAWIRLHGVSCASCVGVYRLVGASYAVVRPARAVAGRTCHTVNTGAFQISSSIPIDSSLRGRFTCVGSAVTPKRAKAEHVKRPAARLTGFRRPLFPRKSAILLTAKPKIFVWLARRARSALRRFSVLRLWRAKVRRQSLHFPRITIIL